MTQRIFDIENEKDMQDLWDILPYNIIKLTPYKFTKTGYDGAKYHDETGSFIDNIIAINWHDATEITRPVYYEDMIGCVCKFSTCPIRIGGCFIGVLDNIDKDSPCKFHVKGGGWFEYCEPVKKSELKFWGVCRIINKTVAVGKAL